MKFYGDYFEKHYCLPDEDWNIVTASSASFSTPLAVNGLFNTTANGIDGILNGGNKYQLAGLQILFCFVSHEALAKRGNILQAFRICLQSNNFFPVWTCCKTLIND